MQKLSKKCSTNLLSKSSPPKNLSPFVDNISKFCSSLLLIFRIVTSKVPPPKSKTNIFFSLFFPASLSVFPNPYANAAAVGSLIILKTSIPANFAAFSVHFLCPSVKFAGTVITNFLTFLPKKSSALSAIFLITKEDICSNVNFISLFFLFIATIGNLPFSSPTILNGKFSILISSLTFLSLKSLPMNLLIAYIELS